MDARAARAAEDGNAVQAVAGNDVALAQSGVAADLGSGGARSADLDAVVAVGERGRRGRVGPDAIGLNNRVDRAAGDRLDRLSLIVQHDQTACLSGGRLPVAGRQAADDYPTRTQRHQCCRQPHPAGTRAGQFLRVDLGEQVHVAARPDFRNVVHTGVVGYFLTSRDALERVRRVVDSAGALRKEDKRFESLGIGLAEGLMIAEFTFWGQPKHGTLPFGNPAGIAQ